jgi:hypothetical protein
MPLATALLDAAVEDLRVGVITYDNRETIQFLHEFRALIPEDLPHTTRLTSGIQSITFPAGGEIHFYSHRQSLRGHSLDRVYATEFDADDKYWPNVHARPGGKVVLY